MLDAENGVPMSELEGKVEFYSSPSDRPGYRGFVRRSPNLFKRLSDGEMVMQLLKQAHANPVIRPVDPAKRDYKPLLKAERKKGKRTVQTLVSIPETNEPTLETAQEEGNESITTPHTEIQYRLLRLGAEMGFDVWVARNDRSKLCNGIELGSMAGIVEELPTQFNEATNRTIELIDVLWLKGNSIIAAFEVECTTAIYSGLLRMSDLLALQPNLNINLYIVAPEERKDKVEQEILRPTFMLRENPLAEDCGFLAIEELMEKIDVVAKIGLATALKPEFLEQMAEYFTTEG